MWTAVEHGSVGPKESAKAVSKVAIIHTDDIVKIIRKGIGLIFPNSDTEIGLSGSNAATQTNSEMSAKALGRVFFSL
jgi:hypothetical protein